MAKFTNSALNWLSMILQERFGHRFMLEQVDSKLKLCVDNQSKGYILFPKLEEAFHLSHSNFPCGQWDATKAGWISVLENPLPVPCVIDLPDPLIVNKENHSVIHYDILGLTYWMLNRIEEIGRTDLDNHDRFPAISSHAYKYNYLERPIVDEWLHILGQVIQCTWPSLELKKHHFSIKVSHDVDSPSLYAFKPWSAIIRMMVGNLLKRRDLKAFFTAPYVKLISNIQISKVDPYNTFEKIMDISDKNGLKSAFYFICGRTSQTYDADYDPNHLIIRNLIKRINERGHEIGLHPSYATYQKTELIKLEFEKLKFIVNGQHIKQRKWGGRMHYLRWEHPATLQALSEAGFFYDTTLSYADRPGFRCGTCHEYPAFNAITQNILQIRIRPLIAMECTIIDKIYLGLGISHESLNKFLELRNSCERVDGVFTLLWHNSYFQKNELNTMYEKIIETNK